MKVRALVIDDSRVMRSMVMQSLRHTRLADFDFTEAEDGLDGLDKLCRCGADIIFVDWNMPRMSGIDFVRRVRSSAQTRTIPIVMVTSERAIGKVTEATDSAGADAYIRKPFTVEDLSSTVSGLLKSVGTPAAASGGLLSRLLKGA